ncbi:MAG: hypothetical protein ACRENN_01350 [Candidatus Eiseniibacteriota bacterium]
MKRFKSAWILASVVALVGFAVANAAEEKKAEPAKPAAATISGEIVDMGCYMDHGAMGEKHASCAAMCAAQGSPIGLLTDKGVVYLMTAPHENKDAYNKAKEWAGKKVEITGMVHERGGMKSIEVASAKVEPAAAKG